MLLELARQVGRIRVAEIVGDPADAPVGVGEKVAGALHLSADEVRVWRHAHGRLKRPNEVMRTEGRDLGHLFERRARGSEEGRHLPR